MCSVNGSDVYSCQLCSRIYHVYKDIWDPVVDETLNCERENRNSQDPYAVGMKKIGITVRF